MCPQSGREVGLKGNKGPAGEDSKRPRAKATDGGGGVRPERGTQLAGGGPYLPLLPALGAPTSHQALWTLCLSVTLPERYPHVSEN